MKKLLCLGSFIAMILAAPGCDRNNTEPEDKMVTRVLYAVNSDTRTALQGNEVVWSEGDNVCCISVYEDDRLNAARAQLYCNIEPAEMNGSSARITVTSGAAYTPKYIVYPSSNKVACTNDWHLEIPVPESYIMVKDNIPAASNIAVGVVENENVYMKNAMALLKFEIVYPEGMDEEVDGIKQMSISANGEEAIGGKLIYDPVNDKVTATEGVSKVILYPPVDEPYFPAGVYYLPLPSISLSQGLKVKFMRADDWAADKTYAQALDLERNRIINMGKTSEWGLEFANTTRVLSAQFSNGTLINNGWPFTEAFPKIDNVCGKGIVGPFHLPENDDAPFYFYVQTKNGTDSWRTTNGAGLRFGGSVHDYMLLPAIDGYKLTSVMILSGKTVEYAITDNPSSGTPEAVLGGEKAKISEKKSQTFILSGTKAGTAYRIDLPTVTWASFWEFSLTYEKD